MANEHGIVDPREVPALLDRDVESIALDVSHACNGAELGGLDLDDVIDGKRHLKTGRGLTPAAS
jgi:hypothetical protein